MTPATVTLGPAGGASITLRDSGGPVTWTITESASLAGLVTVAPTAGQLLADRSVTVSLNVITVASLDRMLTGSGGPAAPAALGPVLSGQAVTGTLTVNPGGHRVTVTLKTEGCGCPSPSPSPSDD